MDEKTTDFKYQEDKTMEDIMAHIKATYDQHYGAGKIQTTEFILDSGHGEGFCMGNIMKYAQRYGKKEGKNLTDLIKLIHYAMILYYNEQTKNNNNII